MSFSTKSIAIGIIIGLVVGLVVGYAVQGADTTELEQSIRNLEEQLNNKNKQIATLQSQISELQSQIEELEKLVPPLRKGQWNTIITFTGSSYKTTELFYIPSATWRINWTYTGGEMTVFSFFVYPEGETAFFVESLLTMGPGKSDVTYIYKGQRNFYIKVITSATWTLTIQAFIPE